MSDTQLDAVMQKHTGLSCDELQNATWTDIDELAQSRNGSAPVLRPFSERFGDLSVARRRWAEIGTNSDLHTPCKDALVK